MNRSRGNAGGVSVHVGGSMTGNIAAGEGNVIHIVNSSRPDDVEAFKKALEAFKQEVGEAAPPEKKDAAVRRADMLADEALAEEPDAGILESYKSWFVEHIPAVAESVASVLGHPILGRVLGAAGRALGG